MTNNEDLAQRIEAIETGYEFMLAYAAQGRATDKGAAAGRNIREYLDKMATALDGLGALIERCAHDLGSVPKSSAAFLGAVEADARVALGMLDLVRARADISSQLIDNLNASIHLRALLTDLFVVDEALRAPRPTV